MSFDSATFAVFLVVVFVCYWRLSKKGQNVFILLASYLFYGWWDWRFLSLIAISSAVDFLVGKGLGGTTTKSHRRLLLFISLGVNLGILGVFKYFGFFADGLIRLGASMGITIPEIALNVVLPVGISFYTFQTLSYTIDIYRGRCAVHHDVVEFFAFVAFFPQLVAGPIERASHLLPQFSRERRFDSEVAYDGVGLMLWGLVKKVVIADGLAGYVDRVYGAVGGATGAEVVLATYFFALQIYCDFSGYSDIAIGTAKLFGFDLRTNFRFPYFSAGFGEFWRRWHVSLSTWFRDYVYIPLGGSRVGQSRMVLAVLTTFLLSGLWHGANWTFIVWGFFHAICYLITVRWEVTSSKTFVHHWLRVVVTFHLVALGWVAFRAASLGDIAMALARIGDGVNWQTFLFSALRLKLLVVSFLFMDLLLYRTERIYPTFRSKLAVVRSAELLAMSIVLIFCGTFSDRPFIYFQF